MKTKAASGIMLTLLLAGVLTLAFNIEPAQSEPRTWTVDDDGPADFNTIQEAINAASPGDIIYVCNGTYHETVIVNKTVALIGEDKYNCIINKNSTGTVITVAASNVTVSGFTIRGNGWRWSTFLAGWVPVVDVGIYLGDLGGNNVSRNIICNISVGISIAPSNNIIYGNNITNTFKSGIGIFLSSSSNNTISGNNITNNIEGIALGYSSNNTISGNNITKNSEGIAISMDCSNNIVYKNNITNNEKGIHLVSSSSNNISGNNIVNNKVTGIDLSDSDNNTICENKITDNTQGGVYLGQSSSNIISENNITNSWIGVSIFGATRESSNNIISRNNIISNRLGISFSSSSNNTIYHNNFINNTDQTNIFERANVWDDGYPSGGNYWSDYNGTDANSDGIGDTPYVINENNQDNNPLMNPWNPSWNPTIPPWTQWWFWRIVITTAGIIGLAGAVYFWKERKKPTPTVPPPFFLKKAPSALKVLPQLLHSVHMSA